MRLNRAARGMVLDAFRGWGTHVPDAKSGKRTYKAEFQIPDGPLVNAAGFFLWLHATLGAQQVPWRARGYFAIYAVLREAGIARGSHAPQHWTGAFTGTPPQTPSEVPGLVLDATDGNVPVSAGDLEAKLREQRSRAAQTAQIRADYAGLSPNRALRFHLDGMLVSAEDYAAARCCSVRRLRHAVRDRLPNDVMDDTPVVPFRPRHPRNRKRRAA